MIRCLLLLIALAVPLAAASAEFKTVDQCKPGTKVQDRKDRSGTITRVSNGMCYVRFAGADKDENFLHWMLRPAGESKVTSDKLAKGVYKCYHSGGYAFIDIHIDGPDAYRDKKGNAGRYSLDASSGKITFRSGTLQKAN